MLHAMIMAGGGGTRFWPRSRNARPKQFLKFSGDRTLLQGTYDRVAPIIPAERLWVLTGEAYVAESAEQLPEVPRDQVVGEPCRRDTAPCVGLGAALIARTDPDATMIVLPADHVIEPEREFQRAVLAAGQFADDHPDALFTFGIPPTNPSTNYGYIHRGERVGVHNGVPLFKVQAFKEKPSEPVARDMLATGQYDWNSGIFVWKVKTILSQLAANRPDIHQHVMTIVEAWDTAHRLEVFRREYAAIKGTSIDFAVMETAPVRMVMQTPYQWDDVGSWLALERHNPQDAHGNTVQGRHLGVDTTGCVITTDADHLIATLNVKDLLIVHVGDATLVANKNDEARVKEIVERLKKEGPNFL
ncbi:mannose-1-phosphate guanylyltransferase [soil metagenome]